MAAAIGNQNAKGNKGGPGRMKAGDEQYLLDLWNGEVKDEDVQPKFLFKRNSTGTEMVWKSGKAAFAYAVLRGSQKEILKLLDKLYANKQAMDMKIDDEYFNDYDELTNEQLETRRRKIEDRLKQVKQKLGKTKT